MGDYKQALVNEDGELLGYDYIYADSEDLLDSFYDQDFDDYEEDDEELSEPVEKWEEDFMDSAQAETEQDRAAWYDQDQF